MAFISKITLPNNSNYNLKDKLANVYVVCSTSAAIAEKSISITDFELVVGATIHITFLESNSAETPTLKINDLAAKPIYLNNGNISLWDAGETVAMTYDGTYWRLNDYGKIEVIRL